MPSVDFIARQLEAVESYLLHTTAGVIDPPDSGKNSFFKERRGRNPAATVYERPVGA